MLIVISVFCVVIAGIGTRLLARVLVRRGVLDRPNERSSHDQPKPRGGGIALILAVFVGAVALDIAVMPLPKNFYVLGAIVLALASISWVDDLKGLSPFLRLASQIFCVGGALVVAPFPAVAFLGGLPGWLQFGALGIVWLWFINLYNFMDGIDGITGVETIFIVVGIAVLTQFGPVDSRFYGIAIVIAAASAGFLIWNWPPSKIFLGDVGSIPLGFIIGWLLLELAAMGFWAAALILPGYYLADATITLFRRAVRGEKIWLAHREHFYQKATQNGLSHAAVVMRIICANAILLGLAIFSTNGSPLPALAGAACVVGVLLYHFASYGRNAA